MEDNMDFEEKKDNEEFTEDAEYSEVTEEEKPKKKRLFWKIFIPVLIVAIIALAAIFGIKYIKALTHEVFGGKDSKEWINETEESTAETEKTADDEDSALLSEEVDVGKVDINSSGTVLLDVSSVVEKIMPSVVSIVDTLEYKTVQNYNPYNFYFNYGSGSEEKKEIPSSGSGVIIGQNDSALLFVTNNHVVAYDKNYYSSKGLTVTFSDGTSAEATVKGTNSELDLAIVAIPLSELSTETKDAIKIAIIGNSDKLKVGAGVIAIGNALGYGQSVTAGIISAKDREVTIEGITRKLMQTDAAINPGNSGGGLFNAKGELVGINSAKNVDTDVEGMGFAIPITSVSDIIENLMKKEPIPEGEEGYIGVNGETVPSNYIKTYGYPEGVSITRITENSPADKAGLQIYDIITEVNGVRVTALDSMKSEINSYKAGTEITVKFSRPEGRGFKEMEAKVTLVSYKDLTGEDPVQEENEETEESKENNGNGGGALDPYNWFWNFFNN